MGERVVPVDVLDIYTDAAQLGASIYSFALTFGTRSFDHIDDGLTPKVRLRMSPQHAKAITLLLMAMIRGYERQYGMIPVDPDLTQQLEAANEVTQSTGGQPSTSLCGATHQRSVTAADLGWSPDQIRTLYQRLETFAEDWLAPEMDAYDTL